MKGKINRKTSLNNSRTCSETIRAQAAYTEANKMMKKNIRADKRAFTWIVWLSRQRKQLATATRELSTSTQKKHSGIFRKPERPLKDKMGPQLLEKKDKERDGWNTSKSF